MPNKDFSQVPVFSGPLPVRNRHIQCATRWYIHLIVRVQGRTNGEIIHATYYLRKRRG